MNFSVRRHPWSSISIMTTTCPALAIFSVIRYMHARGQWNEDSLLSHILHVIAVAALLVSLVTAVTAIAKEEPVIYGIVALCLSLFSFFFYVT